MIMVYVCRRQEIKIDHSVKSVQTMFIKITFTAVITALRKKNILKFSVIRMDLSVSLNFI